MKQHILLALTFAVLVFVPVAGGQDGVMWPTQRWETSAPEAEGMSSEELSAYFGAWSQPQFNFDSMIMVRNGKIVAEAYGPLTQPDDLRQLASVSKSFTSALIGVMLQDGLLESLDVPVLSQFPNTTIAQIDANKEALTVGDLLVMGSGIECNDMGAPPTEPGTSDLMETTDDWLQFALDLPVTREPGTQWYYCSAGVHVLSGIISEVTGMSARDYAAEKLFTPLGITDFEWSNSPTDVTYGYSDLKLSARDMAKFGYLYLNHGAWDGQQIMPADYADASLAQQIATPWNGTSYGYLWWRVDPINLSFALGLGGQYIMVFPDKDLVVAATSAMTENIRPGLQAYPMFFAAAQLMTADEPLPENSAAADALQDLLASIHEPEARPVPALPALASSVSGQMYGLAATNLFMSSRQFVRFATYNGFADTIGVNWFTLAFDESAEASLTVGFTDNETWTLPVGLDGLYRMSEGRPGTVGVRGEWLGETLFRVDLRHNDEVFLQRLDFNFIPGGVYIISYDYTNGQGITLQGVAMQP